MPVQPARRRRTAVTAALLVLTLASCARAHASRAPTVTPSSPAAVSPTSVAARPTSPAPGAAATDAPSITAAPSTTAVPTPSERVAADFLGTFDAYRRCGADPASCDLTSVASPASPVYDTFADWIELLASEGIRMRPGSDDQIVIERVDFEPGAGRARVEACVWDTGAIYDPNGTADPSDDIVFDDHHVSSRAIFGLDPTPEGWRQATYTRIERRVGENLCDG